MNERMVFQQWAPPASPWSAWAKPVLFTQLQLPFGTRASSPVTLPADWQGWVSALPAGRTALVLELPGALSVRAGLQLVAQGFRPVPLFNTSYGERAAVPVREIVEQLRRGAEVLARAALPAAAPPSFLLDADRCPHRYPALPGHYDNRWLVFPQDFPSSRVLRTQGIEAIVVWQTQTAPPAEDLAHVLRRWQDDGLAIFRKVGFDATAPEVLRVDRPARYRGLFQRFAALLGLRRNSAGGFGSLIPEASQHRGFA